MFVAGSVPFTPAAAFSPQNLVGKIRNHLRPHLVSKKSIFFLVTYVS